MVLNCDYVMIDFIIMVD